MRKYSIPLFLISPNINLFKTDGSKASAKIASRRASTGKNPLPKTKSSLLKPKSRLSTRVNSPEVLKRKKIAQKKSGPKKTPVKKHAGIEKIKSASKLKILQGKTIKAPKIFANQIFTDVYDAAGNHDRIIETLGTLESFDEITNTETSSLLGLQKYSELNFPEYEISENKLNRLFS